MTRRERAKLAAQFMAIVSANYTRPEMFQYWGLCKHAWGDVDRDYIRSITW